MRTVVLRVNKNPLPNLSTVQRIPAGSDSQRKGPTSRWWPYASTCRPRGAHPHEMQVWPMP
jgi:hypothetical protein